MRKALILAALSLMAGLCLAGAAGAKPQLTKVKPPFTLGDWNGVVSFASHEHSTNGSGETSGVDSRVYNVHGGAMASMSGSGQLTIVSRDICGNQLDGWSWSGKGDTSASITIDNSYIAFSFGVVDAPYTWKAQGYANPSGDPPVCPTPRTPQSQSNGGTGSPAFNLTSHGDRLCLTRSSGSKIVTDGGGNPTYNSSSLDGVGMTTTVTWNLTRSGPDRDHDGLADGCDPDPAHADADGDGYPDGWEVDHGTNPSNPHSHPHGPWSHGAPDSDGDGWSDPFEIGHGSNPTDPHSQPPGGPPPDALPIPADATQPIYHPGGRPHGWVPQRMATACQGGTIIHQRCKDILSPLETLATYRDTRTYIVPTLQEEWAMCTKHRIVPDAGDCVKSNLWNLASQVSFKEGLSQAAVRGDCFIFDVSRTKLPLPGALGGTYYGKWSRDYNQSDFLMTPGETRTFNGTQVSCQANNVSTYSP
jgi:hypothetical protein